MTADQDERGPSVQALLEATTAGFVGRFGRPPRFAAVAPGRVNLIGEHTDYNDGFVLPIAIDRRAVIVADAAGPAPSTLVALDLKAELEIDVTGPLAPVPEEKWANYLLGVVDQFNRRGHRVPNLDAACSSSVPRGAGLSSSAAIEVATATLLEQLLSVALTGPEKALLCQQAEHAFPGTPCGIMDMFIAAMAEPACALLIDCRRSEGRAIPLPPPSEAVILIADTAVRHELASGAYAQRRATCEQAARRLGVPALRDATVEMLEAGSLTELEHKRALHVVNENARTLAAADALRRGDGAAFGALMFQSHDSLRYLYEVSCDELDTVVDAARSLHEAGAGVLGARMTGGGFGGSALGLCLSGAAPAVATALRRSFLARHGRELAILATTAAGRAEALSPPRGR